MSTKITKIGVTNDKILARGGLALFLRYVEGTGLYSLVSGKLSPLVPQGNKGLRLQGFVKQMLAFFMDGTDIHGGVRPKENGRRPCGDTGMLHGPTGLIPPDQALPRQTFIPGNAAFNKVLNELFIWRLKMERPKII